MGILVRDDEKMKYKCDNCGAKNYTLEMNRYYEYIWDGPYTPPIGHHNHGATVRVWCNQCKEELTPTKEDMNRLYPNDLKGVVFYE